jgi:hypothetical protein
MRVGGRTISTSAKGLFVLGTVKLDPKTILVKRVGWRGRINQPCSTTYGSDECLVSKRP